MLAVQYGHEALNQRKANTGLMLAQHRRRGANISTALGQCLMFDRLHKLSGRTERTKVKQHVPTSL